MSQLQLYELRAYARTPEGQISREFYVEAVSREDAQRQADMFKFSAFHATGKVMGDADREVKQ
ncbi:hypothetical protein [Pectobacterium versatile]|uniref:hypothetical protein n=1 Tax=Pectobacterium versatile TaxID=2488639 RepID=UPI00102E9F6A|nr:hypothetical protein [Pectobacterium versatile]TAI99836.1 hypothetical protein EG332_04330 [Pectobacterium versatile]UEQ10492.1 hypothetical protein LLE50_05105 [Pectobacterium versatile]GKX40321.1 hypothetical protein SOASR014_40600 [Pectobacterium carotovorum subsp. carotovorum]GLX46406.1 hypothetical protein Pcaca01_40740 [Pectobacterium carotovorum subsp. carotovorum]